MLPEVFFRLRPVWSVEVIKALPFIELCFEIDTILVVKKLIELLAVRAV